MSGARQEVLVLEFADEAKLYVPLEQAYFVSRYIGVGKKSPPLSSLADAKWARAKKNATASIFDYAGKMLALQAERQTNPGHAFEADTKTTLDGQGMLRMPGRPPKYSVPGAPTMMLVC